MPSKYKKYAQSFFITSLLILGSQSFIVANELNTFKECENEIDMQTGCIETINRTANSSIEILYKNGELEEIEREYYENGRLKSEHIYKDGRLERIEREYYENGRLEVEYIHKDNEEGAIKIYYENGKLKGKGTYKNDKLEGIMKTYHENGKLKGKGTYKNGKLNGIATMYYPDGKLSVQITYEDGTLTSGKCSNGKNLTNADLINLSENVLFYFICD